MSRRWALKAPPSTGTGMGVTVQQSAIDPTKLAAATGSLAGAFKKAGPAPTAAAMSVLFLLVALAAAGVTQGLCRDCQADEDCARKSQICYVVRQIICPEQVTDG